MRGPITAASTVAVVGACLASLMRDTSLSTSTASGGSASGPPTTGGVPKAILDVVIRPLVV